MPPSGVFELRWGILSTGSIASAFVADLLVDPATRDVHDVRHKIVAVASRSEENAERFIADKCKGQSSIRALGSYEELYAADDVDCIYLATPHSLHYENTQAALRHRKNVLVEKPATVNAEQWNKLCEIAREEKVFMMEAVWTRFFPISYAYQALIREGAIGEITAIYADLSVMRPLYYQDEERAALDRLVDPATAGGALLDTGPYPLVHILMATEADSPSPAKDGALPLPKIASLVVKALPSVTEKFGPGHVDESAFATLAFPRSSGRTVLAQMTTSMVNNTPRDHSVEILGTKGQMVIPFPPFAPNELIVTSSPSVAEWGANKNKQTETKQFPRPGGISGFAYEADECARCIRDGKQESERIPWRVTELTMRIFDEIRRQNNYRYPVNIEKV